MVRHTLCIFRVPKFLMMLILILSIIFFKHKTLLLTLSLSDARISEISAAPQDVNANVHFDKPNSSLYEVYPVLIPPDWILQICLKDTLLLDKLRAHLNDCSNYSCMFSKVIESESMRSVSSIMRNDTIDDAVSQEFKQSLQDCAVWWKLFKHFDKNANPRRELGRCLFQTFSFVSDFLTVK